MLIKKQCKFYNDILELLYKSGLMPLFLHSFFFYTIDTFIQHSYINIRWCLSPYLHSCWLSGQNFHGVPSRDSNLGLPYSKPAHYHMRHAAPCLSHAAPFWSTQHPSEPRCTLIWATLHPVWATLHSNLSHAALCLSHAAPFWATQHPSRATLHPVWATLHPALI